MEVRREVGRPEGLQRHGVAAQERGVELEDEVVGVFPVRTATTTTTTTRVVAAAAAAAEEAAAERRACEGRLAAVHRVEGRGGEAAADGPARTPHDARTHIMPNATRSTSNG